MPFLMRILLVLTLIPIVEYALLVWISEQIGFTLTLAFVLTTGVVGAWLVRQQGVEAWNQVLNAVRQSQPFGDALFDVVMIGLAGVFLIAPGVLTDIVGFSLLIPSLRQWVKVKLADWLRARAMMQVQAFSARAAGTVIDIGVPPSQATPEPARGEQPAAAGETHLDAVRGALPASQESSAPRG